MYYVKTQINTIHLVSTLHMDLPKIQRSTHLFSNNLKIT